MRRCGCANSLRIIKHGRLVTFHTINISSNRVNMFLICIRRETKVCFLDPLHKWAKWMPPLKNLCYHVWRKERVLVLYFNIFNNHCLNRVTALCPLSTLLLFVLCMCMSVCLEHIYASTCRAYVCMYVCIYVCMYVCMYVIPSFNYIRCVCHHWHIGPNSSPWTVWNPCKINLLN